jgi:hypothetical protein
MVLDGMVWMEEIEERMEGCVTGEGTNYERLEGCGEEIEERIKRCGSREEKK